VLLNFDGVGAADATSVAEFKDEKMLEEAEKTKTVTLVGSGRGSGVDRGEIRVGGFVDANSVVRSHSNLCRRRKGSCKRWWA
jgi:hypothetical protein